MRNKFPSMPSSQKEARARSTRKLKALRRRADGLLYDIAGYWDEGQVSGAIDLLLSNIDVGINDVIAMIDDEMERTQEEAAQNDL